MPRAKFKSILALLAFAMLPFPGCKNEPAVSAPAEPAGVETPPGASARAVEEDKTPDPSEAPYGLRPSDSYYGVYLQGSKVGWMRQQTSVADEIVLSTNLHAEVRGLGSLQKVELVDRRHYSTDGKLVSLHFEQRAATGATTVEGKVVGDTLILSVTSGGATSEQRTPVNESLRDVIAPLLLAREGKVGATASTQRFDASVLKALETDYRVVAKESRLFAGVATETVKISSNTKSLGIKEESWYDETGRVIESRVGGFFVARLEAPDVAKKLDYSQDLLIAAVVKPPKPLSRPNGLERITLDFEGFAPDGLPPESSRQKVERMGEITRVSLSRDALPARPFSPGTAIVGTDPEFLASTPFLQSDHPKIIEAAREGVGDAKDLGQALERLSRYVYERVEDEYVPAYSNALEALESRRGDCTEHATLFVALARALGIPARVAVGIAYWPPGNGFGWHAWAEVYQGKNWIAVDPTWNQPIADVTHVKLAEGGPAEQARIVMMLGTLKLVRVQGA